jgi:hydroxymethylpyrimidine pyrophosphatase-like HAD family hydrolase
MPTTPHTPDPDRRNPDRASLPFAAVICDIDGCLCPESSDPMDAASLAKLADHNRRAGEGLAVPITLCSGRPQPFVEAMCRLIGNRSLSCVAENGVWLYHPADHRYDMDPAITEDHLRQVESARAWVRQELGPLGVVMQPGKAASISLYHSDTALLESLRPRVVEVIREHNWPLRETPTWFYINLDLTHISKATGLDRMLDRMLGDAPLRDQPLLGIGDTLADLQIAEHVSTFACPSNAHEAIKAHADYVSPHAEIAGVLDILAHFGA